MLASDSDTLRRLCVFIAFLALSINGQDARAGDEWPGVKFESVRAYAWPAAQDLEQVVQPNLTLSPGMVDPRGQALTERQVQKLIAAVTRKRPEGRQSLVSCFQPHHAFVFYDAAGRPVAFVELCLRYHGCRMSPDLPEREPHFGDLASLCKELGLALPKDFVLEDYRREFEDTYINGAGFEGAD